MAILEQYIIEDGVKRVVFVDTEEKDFSYETYLEEYEKAPENEKATFNAKWLQMKREYDGRKLDTSWNYI